MSNLFEKEVAALLPWRKGHFRFESGHHGDTWLNLELLCLQPEPVEQLAAVLADCLSEQRPDVVCGPLVEGAFVALMVARRLRVPFTYTERSDLSAVARSAKAEADVTIAACYCWQALFEVAGTHRSRSPLFQVE